LGVLRLVDSARSGQVPPEPAALADVLDAEALRAAPQIEVFRNPAKTLAARMQQHGLVFAGDSPAAAALAEHAAEVLLQSAGRVASAAGLAGVVGAQPRLVAAAGAGAPRLDPMFADEEFARSAAGGRGRVLVLRPDPEGAAARRRIAVFGTGGLVDAALVNADLDPLRSSLTDPAAPAAPTAPPPPGAEPGDGARAGGGGELEQ